MCISDIERVYWHASFSFLDKFLTKTRGRTAVYLTKLKVAHISVPLSLSLRIQCFKTKPSSNKSFFTVILVLFLCSAK